MHRQEDIFLQRKALFPVSLNTPLECEDAVAEFHSGCRERFSGSFGLDAPSHRCDLNVAFHDRSVGGGLMQEGHSMSLKVHHLNCACIQLFGLPRIPLACHCLLIETPSSGLVLVDTGMGTEDLKNPVPRLGCLFSWGYGRPELHDAHSAVAQIKSLGLSPSDVRHIILTHMDLDHISGLADFPQAIIHVHAKEFEAATHPQSRKDRSRYRPALWDSQRSFETYTEQGEPWLGFDAVRGLRGLPDQLFLVPLFGHTQGHCGVAIDSEDGWLLHAGDALFDLKEIHGHRRPWSFVDDIFERAIQADPPSRLRNQQRLKLFAKQSSDVRVICSHDPWTFQSGELPPNLATATTCWDRWRSG